MLTYSAPEEKDPLFDDVVNLVKETGKASVTLIQRKLNLGYARSAKILDELEQAGIVGPAKGDKPREVYISHMVDGKMVEGKVKTPDPKPIIEKKKVEWKMTKYLVPNQKKLEIEIGEDDSQNPVKFDFEKYSNLLIVGSQFTGATKLLNNIILQSITGYHPDNLRLIVIDGNPKDITVQNVPHLLTPLITEPEKAISALKWVWNEISRRMKMETMENEPKILIVISSLNQLMMFSLREFEENIYQILVSGKKCGIYCVLGSDLIPKIPKTILANIPAKIVFKPTDDSLARNNGIPESKNLPSPDEAILETMFEGKKKLNILDISDEKIYEEIF